MICSCTCTVVVVSTFWIPWCHIRFLYY